MFKHYDFIKKQYEEYKNVKCIDINLISIFLKYIKIYLYYPFYYKNISLQNTKYVVSKIESTFKEISSINSDLFFSYLIKIKKELDNTIKMIKLYDPALSSIEEIVLSYPSFYAIFAYKVAHFFYVNNEKSLARIISELAHQKTGIDIHPGAIIGDYFFIDHGTGLVIGETSLIGNYCKIYHGVTLGSKFNNDNVNKRHPTLEDNVTIYANATILGGNTIIKKNSIIGTGVLIRNSVEENSIIKKRSDV